MEFRVLGLLEALDGRQTVPIGRGKEAALLALLVAHTGRPLTVDRIVDELWPEQPPRHAPKTVQIYVSRLRSRLGRDAILTIPSGYLLPAGGDEVDASQAERLVTEGRRLLDSGRAEEAETALTQALGLWRGDAYADFRYEAFAQAEIARLDELRSTAVADLADARLELGWAEELIPELESLVRERPLWERPRRQLMLALYRAGRQSEALELYQATRVLLDAELGLEPGPELQALERAILNQSPEVGRPPRRRVDREQPASPRSTFVGRVPERRELRGALDEALAGRGRVVLLSGEPGIGKSRLMDEVAAEARAAGARVVAGRCWEGGGTPAYWPWMQALRALLPAAGDQLRALPDTDRFALFDGVARLLREASAATPSVVVIDDLHAADEPSLLLLRFLVREIESMPALVLAAYREVDPVPAEALAELQAALAGDRAVSRLRLRGLGADEVEEYLEVTGAGTGSPDLGRRLYEETEGNPLFVAETVRLLQLEQGLRIPDSVRDVIARRLRHLSPECVAALETASILGREFDLEVLGAATGLSAPALLEPLDEALAARVLVDVPGTRSRLRFAHVLIRDTLYDGLSLVRRRQLQLSVFEALEGLHAAGGGHLDALAAHALAAGSHDKALAYARDAAGLATEQRLHEEAARLLRLALEAASATDDRARCELLLELGEAETRAGDADSAKATFSRAAELARALGLGVELARAAAGYGGGVVWGRAGDDHRLVPLLEEGLAVLGHDNEELRIRLLSRLAGALRDEPSRTRREELSREAVELARRSGSPPLLGWALAGRGHAIAGPDTLDECLALGAELRDIGRETGNLERVVAAHSLRILAQLMQGELRGAEQELAASGAAAQELRHAVALWDVISTSTLLALARGELAAAEESMQRALAIGERALPDAARAIYTMQWATLADFRGGLDEVEPELRSLAAATPERPVFRCALTYVHARLGRTGDAVRALDSLDAVPFDQEWLYAMSFLAEAAAIVGHPARAELYELLAPWEQLTAADVGEGFRGSIARYLALLAASPDRAAAHYEAALAANRRMQALPWVALTQRDYGTLLGEQGDSRGASLLDEAASTLEALGMDAAR